MKIFSAFAILIIVYTSCRDGYKYWPISKFNIVDSALKDGEEIKMLYYSRGPNDNRDRKYYMQIVAVSQKTGDTVNILTPINHNFSEADGENVYNYFDQENIASKLIALDFDKSTDIKELAKSKDYKQKKITKIARDPNYDDIADNNFPTVIGTIGRIRNVN